LPQGTASRFAENQCIYYNGVYTIAYNVDTSLNTISVRDKLTYNSNATIWKYDGIAIGKYSHSEGRETVAYGASSHSEGNATKAIGNNSHSEGQGTTASGHVSHAEGSSTIADG